TDRSYPVAASNNRTVDSVSITAVAPSAEKRQDFRPIYTKPGERLKTAFPVTRSQVRTSDHPALITACLLSGAGLMPWADPSERLNNGARRTAATSSVNSSRPDLVSY